MFGHLGSSPTIYLSPPPTPFPLVWLNLDVVCTGLGISEWVSVSLVIVVVLVVVLTVCVDHWWWWGACVISPLVTRIPSMFWPMIVSLCVCVTWYNLPMQKWLEPNHQTRDCSFTACPKAYSSHQIHVIIWMFLVILAGVLLLWTSTTAFSQPPPPSSSSSRPKHKFPIRKCHFLVIYCPSLSLSPQPTQHPWTKTPQQQHQHHRRHHHHHQQHS